MSLIFYDGFDSDDADDIWTANPGASETIVAGRTGPRAATITNGGRTYYRSFNATDEDDGMFVGFAWRAESAANNLYILNLYSDNGVTVHIGLRANDDRSFSVHRGGWGGTELGRTPINLWHPTAWEYVELGVKIHDSTGTIDLRMNGVTILSLTGQDTRNGGTDALIDRVYFGDGFSGTSSRIDDVYVCNEQGSAPFNTFLGDSRVYPLYPNGNGNYSQLVGSDGNSTDNYLLADESPSPSATDYNGSGTAGNKDTYLMENMPVSTGTIRAIQWRAYAFKSDSGVRSIKPIFRRAGVDGAGSDKVLSELPATYMEQFITDPTDASALTIAKVDALEMGGEVV